MSTKYCLLALFISAIAISSCKKDYESIENVDDAKIQEYISKNNLQGITKDPSGFYYQVTNPGTGELLKNTDSVFYDFDIKSFTGTVYQQKKPYANVGNYVGYITPVPFRTAMLQLKRGGAVKLIIPSYLAFGKNGNGNIPSNEIIVSDISILPEVKQSQIDERKITEFLASKGITNAVKDPSRVYYQVITSGTGAEVIDEHSSLVVKYTGRLLDGTVFDTSDSFTTALSAVIQGWGKILPKFKSGTKLRLFIPSDLGYRTSGSGSIPANAVLDFDIEIVSVTN